MNRLDGILMFPLILACLLLERYSIKSAIYRFVAYSILPLLICFAVDAFLPADASIAARGSPITLLLKWHHPTRIVKLFELANKEFATAYPPILVIIFIMACLYLAITHKYSTLFFVLPVVIINYLFWMPNPRQACHFVYLAPTLSVGIALILSSTVEHVSSFITSKKLVTHTGVLIVFLFAYLSISKLDGIKLYQNPFSSPEQAYKAGRFGQDLQKLPALNIPIFVIADAEPITAKMLLEADALKITRECPSFKFVYNGKNNFIFIGDFSFKEGLVDVQKKTEEYDEFYWIVDPYNPKIQNKIKLFNIEAPSSAKQLDV